MKHHHNCLLFFSCLFTACSCRMIHPPAETSLSIMTWNVQNLFDPVSSGQEYAEFDPDRSEWGEDLLRLRLENLSEVILSVPEGPPDILLLQEVENRDVLERLNREYLGNRYPYAGAWVYTDNAVRCGYLSRRPPASVHLHFPGNYGTRSLRAILEIRFSLEGEELLLLNNHWKSRSGGAAATEAGRLLSAGTLATLLKERRQEGRSSCIVAGDLNGSCDDYRPGGYQTAQIPVEFTPETSWLDSLYIADTPEDLLRSGEKVVLYSPWETIDAQGSYFFQNRWMRLDHFLLTPDFLDGTGWEFDRAVCLDDSWFCDPEGRPSPWETWNGSGYSDHFPLILFLRKIE